MFYVCKVLHMENGMVTLEVMNMNRRNLEGAYQHWGSHFQALGFRKELAKLYPAERFVIVEYES